MKTLLYYLMWTIIIGAIFFVGSTYQMRLEGQSETTYNTFPVVLYATVQPIIMGMLLRLPKLIIEIRDAQKWTFNWIKFVAIGCPSLYIALTPILFITGLADNFGFSSEFIYLTDSPLRTGAGIVFGYVLLEGLKRNRD